MAIFAIGMKQEPDLGCLLLSKHVICYVGLATYVQCYVQKNLSQNYTDKNCGKIQHQEMPMQIWNGLSTHVYNVKHSGGQYAPNLIILKIMQGSVIRF